VAGLAHVLAGRTGRRGIYVLVTVAAAVALVSSLAANGLPAPAAVDPLPASSAPHAGAASILDLFGSGLRAGLLTFGGAYTAIPFVRDDAVGSGWLTDAQFLDGLALSGVLPAPLIIFSTFVGYVAGGPAGAVAMTAGIFLPAFAFSLVLGDRIEAVIENVALHRLLEGVAAGVVGLIAITGLELALVVAGRLPSLVGGALIFGATLAILFLWRSKAAVPLAIAGGALAGFLAFDVLIA
jgi:chromate transporter